MATGVLKNALYTFLGRPQPGGGAREFALLAFQTRPRMPYQGRGIPIKYEFFLTQPPQAYVYPALPVQSITGPGLLAGNFYLTPLLDNPNS